MGGVDPKTLQTRMSHASITTSLNFYARTTSESDRAVADVMGTAVFNSKSHVGRTPVSVSPRFPLKTPSDLVGARGLEPPTSAV